MMLSPEQYFSENINKSRVEQVKAMRKLRQNILELRTKIKKGEKCLEKPDYKTQLKTLESYEDYAITYFLKKRMFNTAYEKDPTWLNVACNFILDCRELELKDLGLEELVAYFTVNTDENDLKSYEKFEHFKKYNNKAINVILDCPEKPKLSYYKVMQQKLKDFPFWFNEEERAREGNTQIDEQSTERIKMIVERDIMALRTGTQFRFRDFLDKYNLSGKEERHIYDSVVKDLENKYILCTQNPERADLFVNFSYERINLNDYFKKIPYEFYLFHSLKGLSFKLSPKIFAVKTRTKIVKMDYKVEKLWDEFLEFVKTAKSYKPLKHEPGVETGVVIEECWKNKFKNLFSKLPDTDTTIDYLIKVFKDNGYNVGE